MKKEFITKSPKQTAELGRRLGGLINNKCLIAFRGDLGAGKTCFVSGFVKGMDYFGEVNSPTFAIVNEYLGGRLPIYHFDVYRITDDDDLYSVGFYDYLEQKGVILVEWSENIEYALPKDSIIVTIENRSETERSICLQYDSEDDFLKEL